MVKKRLLELALVSLFLLLASAVLWLTDADRLVFSVVPRNLTIAAVLPASSWAWPQGNVFPWNTLYRWAGVPAALIGSAAFLLFLLGFVKQRCAQWRRQAAFVLLCLALGPGLTVNFLFKEQYGRARPREVVEFGGSEQFTPFWQPGQAGSNSSFPSGHAAIAFAVMIPWFALREWRRRAAAGFLAAGLLFGSLVGIARILQGGHFPSDILWAGGLIYLIGGLLALLMKMDSIAESENIAPQAEGRSIKQMPSCSLYCAPEEARQ
ncbi:phosphatase PAP2 family protein [Candidatus Electronema sp. JM]|uniref:phosphatase PAP2 family protein n=1 Tax=Candidatus Electronema sp. JM TaxID=3401571 RepID=UPI003AA9519D